MVACSHSLTGEFCGGTMLLVRDAIGKKVAGYMMRPDLPAGQREWPTLKRMLDRKDPSYRD